MDAAAGHCAAGIGIGIWEGAGNEGAHGPDVAMACCGDAPTLETLAAVPILREHLPEPTLRVVNVVDVINPMKLQPRTGPPSPRGST